MIYWFSATGNTKHCADKLAEILGENKIEITKDTVIDKNERIILVIPLYFWSVPQIVKELLQNTNFNKDDKVFVVFTCGGFLGTGDLSAKNLVYPAKAFVYGVVMGTNYIIFHKVSKDYKIIKRLKRADIKIQKIAKSIKEEKFGYKSLFFLKIFIEKLEKSHQEHRDTKPFYSTDKCISCSLCEKNCPDNAIKLIDKKPKWIKEKCQHCLKCVHRCPVYAIEYGECTVGKKRYVFEKYQDKIKN